MSCAGVCFGRGKVRGGLGVSERGRAGTPLPSTPDLLERAHPS